MPYLWQAFFPKDNRRYIEPNRFIAKMVSIDKIPGCHNHLLLFWIIHCILCLAEFFACSRFNFHENQHIAISHNKVNLASVYREIASDTTETFASQIPLAISFSPPAKLCPVSEKFFSYYE
jgi:hypothetical protein